MGITVPKVAGFNTMLILPSLSENITSVSNINTEMLIEVYNNFTLFKVLKMVPMKVNSHKKVLKGVPEKVSKKVQ